MMNFFNKSKSITLLVFVLLIGTVYSCKEEKKPKRSNISTALDGQSTEAQSATTGGVAGVDHYICANGHPGSSVQGNCSVCNTPLTHNAAFHQQPGASTSPTTVPTTNSPVVNPVAPPMGAEPTGAATNAAGVYHYTCPSGHAGGAAGAGACSVCGTALVHNAAFHN